MAEDLIPAETLIGGLNDIIRLVSIGGENNERGRWQVAMDKTSSRIPKLNFGFRKTVKTNTGAQSGGDSSRKVEVVKVVEAGSVCVTSTNTSPKRIYSGNLSRSKSLRITRSAYHSPKENSSSLALERNQDSDDVEEESGRRGALQVLRRGQEDAKQSNSTYFARPQGKIVGPYSRSSLRLISRSVSPRGQLGLKSEEEVEEEVEQSPQPEDNLLIVRDRRTKSFSAHLKNKVTNGSISSASSSSPASPPNAMSRGNATRRSKTPTSLTSSIRSNYAVENADRGYDSQGEKKLVRVGSHGHFKKMSTRLVPTSQKDMEQVQLRKPASTPRSPRPQSSSICADETEASSPLDSSGNKSSLGVRGGGVGRRSHSSMGYNRTADGSSSSPVTTAVAPSSKHIGTGSGRVTPTRNTRYLTAKSLNSSLDSMSSNRPRSATAYYQKERRSSFSKDPPVTKKENRGSSQNRRGSTASSGHSTPVQLEEEGKEITDGGMVSRSPKTSLGLPPRTPYRVARTKAAPSNNLAGMNELEGSVLLEADDYRKLFNEVKALKTALLRLKRELQEESDSASSSTPHVGHSRTSPLPGQMSSMDYNKRLREVGKERDAASDEVTKVRKDSKTKDARIEALKLELALTREQQIATSEELQQVVGQRDRLIEKVERLHAEKHQVEARLNALERSSMYEQTLSDNWLDDLDGVEDEALRESLAKGQRLFADGGRKKGSTGSDVVDSGMQSGGDEESSEA